MLTTNNIIEHRGEPRNDTNVLIKFRPIVGYKAEDHLAVILDINERGASLFSYTLLPVGTKIVIDRGEERLVKAEIVTVTFDKDSDMIRLGVRFVKDELGN